MRFTSRECQALIDRSLIGDVLSEKNIADLRNMYSEPQRHYHTWDHAMNVLSWVLHVCEAVFNDQPGLRLNMGLAALFHDAVYDLERTDNETRSATLMREMVSVDNANLDIHMVTQLILATRNHGRWERKDAPDEVAALFMDCDMITLGERRWEITVCTDDDVVRELAYVTDERELFAGRRQFFKRLIQKQSIFLSTYLGLLFEDQAQSNARKLLLAMGEG